MTRFYINECEVTPPPEIKSFHQILAQADDETLPPNSVIKMVSIDGIPLVQNELSLDSSVLFQKAKESEKVEIITGTVEEIINDSIYEAFEYLDRVEKGIPTLAESFQTKPGPEAFEGLRQLYEGFYWLNLLLEKLAVNFNLDFDKVCIQDVSAKEHNRKYIDILKQLQDSLERGDVVLISDLLEYEITPIVPLWKEMFQIIAQKAIEKP